MGYEFDEQDNSRLKNIENDIKDNVKNKAKQQGKKYAKKAGKKTKKVAEKATEKTIKLAKKISTFILKLLAKILAIVGPYLLIACVFAIIPTLIIMFVASLFSIDVYNQECPELVRAFLSENYDEFEGKIRSLCNDKDFMAYIANIQFDSAYSKMVYGGTNSYTQAELKGNYNGVQGENSSFVSKKGNKYTATSVMSNITWYQKNGVSLDKIYVNDEYINGYSSSGINPKDGAVDFKKWLKASYYNTAFYYWYATGKANEKDDKGNISWKDLDEYLLDYGAYIDTFSEVPKTNAAATIRLGKEFPSKNYSYYNVLQACTKKVSGLNFQGYELTSNTLLESNNLYNPILYGPIALKINSSFDSFLSKWTRKYMNEATGYSFIVNNKINSTTYDTEPDKAVTNQQITADGLNSFVDYNSSKNKITKYLSSLNFKEKKLYGNRQNINNTYVEKWKDNFAEYLAKELYYVYPNRDYITDFFLGKGVEKSKKIEFMIKSFNAMATGSSLNWKGKESYSVQDGQIVNNNSGNSVGKIELNNIQLKNLKPKSVSDIDVSSWSDMRDIIQQSDDDVYYSNDGEYIGKKAKLTYTADIVATDSSGKTRTFSNATVNVTPEDNSYTIMLTDDVADDFNNNKDHNLQKSFSWDSDYYKTNAQTDEGKKSLDNGTFKMESSEITLSCNFGKNATERRKNVASNPELCSPNNISKIINNSSGTKDKKKSSSSSLTSLIQGKIEGCNREIKIDYNDYSCFNYEKNIEYDHSGQKTPEHITRITYNITTHFVDTSKYDDGSGNYRIAYGFEKPYAIREAYHLLSYSIKNKNKKNPLAGVKDKVDFDQLFIDLNKSNNMYSDIMTDDGDLIDIIRKMIWHNETGGSEEGYKNYTEPFTNSSSEYAITVGYMQWYGNEARDVLGSICSWYPKQAKEILGDKLYQEISNAYDKKLSWGNKKSFTASDAKSKIISLLDSKQGHLGQDRFANAQVQSLVNTAKKKGISNPKLIAYWVDMHHQSPSSADLVLKTLIKYYGNTKKMNNAGDTALDKMHEYAMSSSLTGIEAGRNYTNVLWQYVTRRKYTYKTCQNIEVCTDLTNTSSDKDIQSIVNYAISKLGFPYSTKDRNNETSFDCSSFVWHAFNSVGIKISATGVGNTSAILKYCETNFTKVCSNNIDKSKLKAGDILFYDGGGKGSYKSVSHVSLYVGNDKIIESSSAKGKVIKKDASNSNGPKSKFFVAYRIGSTMASGKWTWPVPGHMTISSDYSMRSDPFGSGSTSMHNGIDIPAPSGTKIVAASDGTLAWANYSSTAGNWIGINHGNNVYSVYMHQSSFAKGLKVGQKIRKGQTIGYVGTTGNSTGNHLHFEIRMGGAGGTERRNPHDYLG